MTNEGGVSPSSRRAGIEILIYLQETNSTAVALLAEGGDRNNPNVGVVGGSARSPSSRRAGIEISLHGSFIRGFRGSPSSRRAGIEIVLSGVVVPVLESPSSRRAWIEIS